MRTDGGHVQVDIDAAIGIVLDLAAEHRKATGRPLASIVLVGGTALAAHTIRTLSEDVDLYAPDIDDAVLDSVTKRHAERFGPRFKIDATPSNTLWGAIALFDIERSPVVRQDGGLEIRALSIETLYIVKTAANRDKDQPDIAALAARTTYERTLARAKQMFAWYADRNSFPEHAERLARYMARDYRKVLDAVDADFALPPSTRAKVEAIRNGLEAQFTHVLRMLMQRRPDLITYLAERPDILSFDAEAAGATEEVWRVAKLRASHVSDIAATVLKAKDPARHAQRLRDIKNVVGQSGH